VAGCVVPRSPSVPAREPMPSWPPPPVAPIAASAVAASAGAQRGATATTRALRLIAGAAARGAAIEEPCDPAPTARVAIRGRLIPGAPRCALIRHPPVFEFSCGVSCGARGYAATARPDVGGFAPPTLGPPPACARCAGGSECRAGRLPL